MQRYSFSFNCKYQTLEAFCADKRYSQFILSQAWIKGSNHTKCLKDIQDYLTPKPITTSAPKSIAASAPKPSSSMRSGEPMVQSTRKPKKFKFAPMKHMAMVKAPVFDSGKFIGQSPVVSHSGGCGVCEMCRYVQWMKSKGIKLDFVTQYEAYMQARASVAAADWSYRRGHASEYRKRMTKLFMRTISSDLISKATRRQRFKDTIEEEIIAAAMHPDRLTRHLSFYDNFEEALEHF